MKQNNPFALTFGVKPDNYISRLKQSHEIKSIFENSSIPNAYIITGLRGSGKTVMLSDISNYFAKQENWIVIELITNIDMLEQLASKLYDSSLSNKLFNKKTFGFSFKGLSFSISGETPINNVTSLIEILLNKINKKGKKILVCIDEIDNNDYVKSFVQLFQLLIRKRLPINLLMTGLYQNVYDLQNDKNLTFLYRAPKLNLEPLNLNSIAISYKNLLNINQNESIELAKVTKGYAYAYQVLGFLLYENNSKKINEIILREFDQYLSEYVYEKIYQELSINDIKFLYSFESNSSNKSLLLQKNLKSSRSTFCVYRDRLIKKGLITPTSYGELSFTLPRFYEFLKMKKDFNQISF